MSTLTRSGPACTTADRRGTHHGMSTPRIKTLTDLLSDENAALLTVPEVASILRRDVKSIRTMISAGDLKAKKLGGATYITRNEVLSILDLVSADAS